VEIEITKIKDTKPRREHGDIKALAESIRKEGLLQPLVINQNNELICGRRRYEALNFLKWKNAPILKVETESAIDKLSKSIAENLIRLNLTWQEEIKAKEELDQLMREKYGEIKGRPKKLLESNNLWSQIKTSELLGESQPLVSQDIQLSQGLKKYPELEKEKTKSNAKKKFKRLKAQEEIIEEALPEKLKSKFNIDKHLNQVLCGDCLEIMKQMPDNCVDVVLTDPDYGVGINYETTITSKKVKIKSALEIESELIPFLLECHRITRRDICVFWSGSWWRIHDFFHLVEQAGLKIVHMGIWYKPNGAGATGNGFARRFEVWFWIEGKIKRISEWEKHPDVIMANRITQKEKEGILHPSQKPEILIERLMKFFSKEGDIILDPYIGSGTTAVVAKKLKRNFIGIDINPIYCKMSNTRLNLKK